MKKLLRVFVLIVILAGVGTWIGFTLYQNKQILEEKNEPQKIEDRIEVYPVKVSRVSRREIRDTLQLQGNFEARKELRIIAEAQGRLSQLYIDDGDRVRKGEVVGKIDDTSLQSRLATARASYEQAAKDVERYQRLYEAGAVSLKQYEEVQLAAKNARTDLTSIEQQLEYTNVKSPMSGTLDEVAVEQGSFVSPGAPIGTVVDISRLLLVVQVPEAEVVKLREGERVPVYADVYPGLRLDGRIRLISVKADASRKYDVEVEVPNTAKYPLRAGMYGTAVFNLTEQKGGSALFIPRKSIAASVKRPEVFVLQPDSTVAQRRIQVGRRRGEAIEVTQGLREGEQVITTGMTALNDGARVSVIRENGSKAASSRRSGFKQ